MTGPVAWARVRFELRPDACHVRGLAGLPGIPAVTVSVLGRERTVRAVETLKVRVLADSTGC